MAFTKVCSLSSLPPGSVTEATIGQDVYAICNVNGGVHALSGICAHEGGPVGQGQINEGFVFCPWHEWGYNCATGENDYDPSIRLDRFAVKIEGDDILVDPEARA
jgi:nitrite reductase (NADH) small subunit